MVSGSCAYSKGYEEVKGEKLDALTAAVAKLAAKPATKKHSYKPNLSIKKSPALFFYNLK
jgi:hypothetical protein